jgi:hypothetical protein
MGKSLRDPRTLYKGTHGDLRKAYELFANDVACSYVGFLEVPIVRAFVRRYHTGGPVRDLAAEEPWKIRASRHPAPESIAWDCIYRRYHTSEEEIEEVERMIRESDVGVFLEHPLFDRLAAADYA